MGYISAALYGNSEKISGQGIGELLKQVWEAMGAKKKSEEYARCRPYPIAGTVGGVGLVLQGSLHSSPD
jgi:hypothetical protein